MCWTPARSVELTLQLAEILRIGSFYPVTLDDLQSVKGGGTGNVRRATGDLHGKLIDFVHKVAVHRGDEAIRWWRNWLREDPLVHPYKVRPDLVPPAAILQCKPHLTPGGSGVLADPARIDKEFEKGFALLLSLWAEGGQPLRNSLRTLMVGCPCLQNCLHLG